MIENLNKLLLLRRYSKKCLQNFCIVYVFLILCLCSLMHITLENFHASSIRCLNWPKCISSKSLAILVRFLQVNPFLAKSFQATHIFKIFSRNTKIWRNTFLAENSQESGKKCIFHQLGWDHSGKEARKIDRNAVCNFCYNSISSMYLSEKKEKSL